MDATTGKGKCSQEVGLGSKEQKLESSDLGHLNFAVFGGHVNADPVPPSTNQADIRIFIHCHFCSPFPEGKLPCHTKSGLLFLSAIFSQIFQAFYISLP